VHGAVVSRVYVSLPLRGPAGRTGRELLRGAQLALESIDASSVELVVLDAFGGARSRAAGNAKRAAEDADACAYLGDLTSREVARTAPILGAAGILQVAPIATAIGLRGKSLVRLAPDDTMAATAISEWVGAADVSELLIVHDYGDDYGEPVATLCETACQDRVPVVRRRRVWDYNEDPARDVGDADAILYVGAAGSGVVGLWETLSSLAPAAWLLGTSGIAVPFLAQQMTPAAVARSRFFVPMRAALDCYGYEGAALAIDAIVAANGDRGATRDTARGTRDRRSVIGRYSLDEHGLTTNATHGRLLVSDGEFVPDVAPVG
jgi:hypothetical protein